MPLRIDPKSVWQYPLERGLLTALMKNKEAKIQCKTDQNSTIWYVGEYQVSYEPSAVYSPLRLLIARICHTVFAFFSNSYNRSYNEAYAKLVDSQNAEEVLKKDIGTKATNLPETAKKIHKRKNAANLLFLSATKKKKSFQEKINRKKELIIDSLKQEQELVEKLTSQNSVDYQGDATLIKEKLNVIKKLEQSLEDLDLQIQKHNKKMDALQDSCKKVARASSENLTKIGNSPLKSMDQTKENPDTPYKTPIRRKK